MDESSQAGSQASALGSTPALAPYPVIDASRGEAMPSLSIRFAVHPHTPVAWKIASDSTLRVSRERIWLTRARSPYDHWLGPGDAIGLARGERIWLSSDAPGAAEVTLTSAWSRRHTAALAWIEWFAGCAAVLAQRRAR
jgi:hypothetical protein